MRSKKANKNIQSSRVNMPAVTWCYVINVLGKNPRAGSYGTSDVTVDDFMDVIVTKEQTQQFTLPFTTVEDGHHFQVLFGLTADVGLYAPLPKCSIVGVNRRQSQYTVDPAGTLNIIQFMDDCCMLDRVVLEYCPGVFSLKVSIKFQHAIGGGSLSHF